jgi:hypothetical protein
MRAKTTPIKPSIFAQLSEKGEAVTVTGASLDIANDKKLQQLIDSKWTESWVSALRDDAWICFAFGDQKIFVVSYSLKSSAAPRGGNHLKSWLIEGSMDSRNWDELHSVVGCDPLNAPAAVVRFQLDSPAELMFLKLTQKGPSHAGPGSGFSLSGVDLFGGLL